jgi:hypothetical protein
LVQDHGDAIVRLVQLLNDHVIPAPPEVLSGEVGLVVGVEAGVGGVEAGVGGVEVGVGGNGDATVSLIQPGSDMRRESLRTTAKSGTC